MAYGDRGAMTGKKPESGITQCLEWTTGKKYWQSKMPHLSPTLNEVNGNAMEQAICELPTHKWRWVTKQITGQFAHGKNMQRQGQQSMANCPRCETELEDKLHILCCKAPGA